MKIEQIPSPHFKASDVALTTINLPDIIDFSSRIGHFQFGVTALASRQLGPEDESLVSVLEALLVAEEEFFTGLFAKIAETAPSFSDFHRLRHDDTFHIARFLFLLAALDCEDHESLENLLISHNRAVDEMLSASDFPPTRAKEIGKARFKLPRIFRLRSYFRSAGEPVFGVTDLADLLFSQMRRTRALEHIETLRLAGLLKTETIDLYISDADGDAARGASNEAEVILSAGGTLEALYADYLQMIREGVQTGGAPAPPSPKPEQETTKGRR